MLESPRLFIHCYGSNHGQSRGETDVYYPSLVGRSVNLGGFDSCLNRKSGVHGLSFVLTIENSALNPSSPKWSDTISHFKLVFTCGRTHKDQSPGFIDCDLFANDDRLLTIRKRSGSSVSKAGYNAEFEWNHPALPFASTLTDELQDYLEKWSGFLAGYEVVSLTFLMSKLFLQQSDEGFLDKNENIPKAFHQFLAHELPASIGEIFTAFSHTAHELVYIPPLREIPDRSMDLRSCELPGWHWLAKRPEIADKTNDTLKNLNIDHRVKIRHLLPADTVKENIIQTLAQAETGRDWGGLSYVVENARETWDAFLLFAIQTMA